MQVIFPLVERNALHGFPIPLPASGKTTRDMITHQRDGLPMRDAFDKSGRALMLRRCHAELWKVVR